MRTRCAASTLTSGVLAGPLHEVARTSVSVHFTTGDPEVPVLCVATPEAVRLPNSVLVPTLPSSAVPELLPTRWWRPARPRGLAAPEPELLTGLAHTSYGVLSPAQLVGSGPGLTPTGDDVLAGALVAAHATADPRLGRLAAGTRAALAERTTTAVSRGLLTHALSGYAIPELADLLVALARGVGVAAAADRLRAVGHDSGQSLLDGVAHLLSTRPFGHRAREGAA